jgi:hypothetical protein
MYGNKNFVHINFSVLIYKICNNYDRPWKYSILLTSIENYRKSSAHANKADKQ